MKVDPAAVHEFLAQRRIAVVGVSSDPRSFANTVYRSLRDRGYEVVPVNARAVTVEGDRCYTDVAHVPGLLDGVLVMVRPDRAADVVRASVERGAPRVWLFKGAGRGAVSDAAIALCEAKGVSVVPGACPLMFLEPAGWFHRAHRGLRRLNGSLARAG